MLAVLSLAASSMLLVAGCNNQPAALAPESPAKPAMAGPNPAQTHTATNTPLPMPAPSDDVARDHAGARTDGP